MKAASINQPYSLLNRMVKGIIPSLRVFLSSYINSGLDSPVKQGNKRAGFPSGLRVLYPLPLFLRLF
jgi:hypothetical protein